MNNITLIAAIGKNNELGKNNDLIWRFKKDLEFFKEQTMNKKIVMGYNTFMSLRGGKPLPNRIHIVLTRKNKDTNKELDNEQIIIVNSKEELLNLIENSDEEFMIIGGSTLYNMMYEYANKMILTEIDEVDKEAEVFFPDINKNDWNIEELSNHQENSIKYKHLVYKRNKGE